MNQKHLLKQFHSLAILSLLLLAGCATNPSIQRLNTDPRFQDASRKLVTAYLDSQKVGGSQSSFGPGAGHFYNLAEYQIVSFGWELNEPTVFVRIKAGNRIGGNPVWENYAIRMRHNPTLEANGDPYLGLRISSTAPSLVNF